MHTRPLDPVTAFRALPVVLALDLDAATRVQGPLQRAKLSSEYVVEFVDVDLAILEQLAKVVWKAKADADLTSH